MANTVKDLQPLGSVRGKKLGLKQVLSSIPPEKIDIITRNLEKAGFETTTINDIRNKKSVDEDALRIVCSSMDIDFEKAKAELAGKINYIDKDAMKKAQGSHEEHKLEKKLNDVELKPLSSSQKRGRKKSTEYSDGNITFDLMGIIPLEIPDDIIIKKYNELPDTQKIKVDRKDNVNALVTSDLVLEDVTKVKENIFDVYMTVEEAGELWFKGDIAYNSDIQRGLKIVGGKEKAIFVQKKVDDIVKAIKSGTYTFDPIYVALYNEKDIEGNNLTDKPLYEDEDRSLFWVGKKFVIEGQHRLHAFAKLWIDKMSGAEKGSKLDDLVLFKFIYADEDEAKKIFVQLSKTKNISKSRIIALEDDKYSSLVRILNKESDFAGQINMVSTSTVQFLTSATTLREALIMTGLELLTDRSIKKEADYLIDFFATLIEEFPKYFSDRDLTARKELRDKSMLNNSLMFYALIALAYYDKENYEANIKKLHDIDFDKTNPIWAKFNKNAGDEGAEFVIRTESGTKTEIVNVLFEQLGLPTKKGNDTAV